MSEPHNHEKGDGSSSDRHHEASAEDSNSPQLHSRTARGAAVAAAKSSTPLRLYPPSAAAAAAAAGQQSMQQYPSPYFTSYHHPANGSPAPPQMYQQQRSYGEGNSPANPGGPSGNNTAPYGYMPQPFPPNTGPQGNDSPSQTSMGNPMNHSPSAAGGGGMGPPAMYRHGGPSNNDDPSQQHPPPNYPSFHHQQQQQWNYTGGPPPFSGMSPQQPQMQYPAFAPHDGGPPSAQPYGYSNWQHQQQQQQQEPPPYYQGWNGMPQMMNPHEHAMPPPGSVLPHPGSQEGGSNEGPSATTTDENKIEGLAGPPSGLKRTRPLSQEMLKSVTSPSKLPDSPFPAPKSPSEIQNSQREEIETMGCTCKKTNCLKLYCQCFGVKIYCGNNCRCSDCHNMPDYEEKRQDAMASIMSRNPVAFVGKYKKDKVDMAAHRLGCKCRKSACLKKYCECFAGGVNCSKTCRCIGCKNLDGKAARQMQALERAQLAERQRQKTQQPPMGGPVPPRPPHSRPSAGPQQQPQGMQQYYPHPPHQYQYPPSHQMQGSHSQHAQFHQPPPPHFQQPPHMQQQVQQQASQFNYQPQQYPPQHPNMPNHYGQATRMGYPHQTPVLPPAAPPQQQGQEQTATVEPSWDAAQSLTFLKRSSPASNQDKESNDLRMAAAMALTGFGQSPSAPPPNNSLLTPIRPPTEDSNETQNDAGLKRNINFDDEDENGQRDAKRQKPEEVHQGDDDESGRRINKEQNHYAEYGPGEVALPQQSDQASEGGGIVGPTEVAYV